MKQFKLFLIAFLFSASAFKAQKDSTAVKSNEIPFQFTFITPVGTNGLESYKKTNIFSINLLAGVSGGLHGCEFGGLANVILKDVEGVQFAGFSNVVLGSVKGGQFASYFNYCGDGLRGVSVAGGGNLNRGELHGGQFAGIFNITRKGGRGVQIAAYSNIMLGEFKGTQVASCVNVAKDIEGAQISAGFNYAKKVKGIQLGIVNVADTVEGASIGFLNFIKKGIHQMEISGDELFYANLSYRTGTRAFYNIFSAGVKPGTDEGLWQFGYGAGTSIKIKERLSADLSATIHHVNTNGFYWGTSELLHLYCGVEYKLTKKIGIAVGPTLNFYMSDALLDDYNSSKKNLLPYHSFDHTTSNDFNIKGWVGGRIALRFF